MFKLMCKSRDTSLSRCLGQCYTYLFFSEEGLNQIAKNIYSIVANRKIVIFEKKLVFFFFLLRIEEENFSYLEEENFSYW